MSAQSGRLSAPAASPVAARPWWQLAILGAAVATVLNVVLYAIAVWIADIELLIPASPGGSDLREMGIGPVVAFSVLPALLAAGLAALLARRTSAPRRWFGGIALVVLLGSLLPVFSLDVTTGAKLTLVLMHAAAAAVIVAALFPRLAAEEGRAGR